MIFLHTVCRVVLVAFVKIIFSLDTRTVALPAPFDLGEYNISKPLQFSLLNTNHLVLLIAYDNTPYIT